MEEIGDPLDSVCLCLLSMFVESGMLLHEKGRMTLVIPCILR